MPETKNLILRKAVQRDWEAMYRNIWRHQESAKYMVWNVTTSEEEAKSRMERTIRFEAEHPYCWIVVDKESREAIGFAGMEEIEPGVWEESGIAIGPEFTGKGYGKQILTALVEFAREKGGQKFLAAHRTDNIPSMKMQRSCGFQPACQKDCVDPRDGKPYILQYNELIL